MQTIQGVAKNRILVYYRGLIMYILYKFFIISNGIYTPFLVYQVKTIFLNEQWSEHVLYIIYISFYFCIYYILAHREHTTGILPKSVFSLFSASKRQ